MTNLKSSYLAFVLDKESSAKLLSSFELKYPRKYGHHITLAFNPIEADLEEWVPGSKTTASVYAIGSNELAQAVLVSITDSNGANKLVRRDKKNLHVTLSVSTTGAPSDSNKIADNSFNRVAPLKITGEIKLIPKRHPVYIPSKL